MFGGNDGVFVEAACVAQLGGVGQFAAADVHDGLGNLGGGGRLAAVLRGKRDGKVAVLDFGRERFVQRKGYGGDDVAAFALLFEQAFAVAKLALGVAEGDEILCF